MAVDDRLSERPKGAHAVVAAGGRLQQRAASGRLRVRHPPDERRGERLRAGDEGGQPRVAVGALGILRERLQVGVRTRIDLGPRGRDHGLVEGRESHLPREIGQDRVATVRRRGQLVEHRAEVGTGDPGAHFLLLEPTVEDREHGALHGGGPLLGQEQPVARLLQCRRAVEVLDPVMAQCRAQLLGVVVREARGLRVERAEEGMQMLLRAAHQLALVLIVAVARPAERTEVRKLREQAVLTLDERVVAGQQVRALAVQVADDPLHLGGVDVVAEHGPFEPLEVLAAALRRARQARTQRRERDPLAGRPVGSRPVERLELQQRRVGGDVDVRARQDLSDPAPERRDERRLHLHALDHGDHVAGLDRVTRRDRDRDDDGRRQVADQPAVVAADAMRDAVDLDVQVGAVLGDDRAVGGAGDLQPPLVGADAPHADLDGHAVDRHAMAFTGDLADRAAVRVPAMAQLDHARRRAVGLRPAAAGERVETRAVGRRLGLADLDRRLQNRHVGVAHRDDVALQLHPVQPGRVHVTGAQFGPVEQLEQEALVRGPALDDDDGLRDSAAQPSERLVAVAPPGDQLRDRRVELGGGSRHPLPPRCRHARAGRSAAAAARPAQEREGSPAPRPRRSASPRRRGRGRAAALPPAGRRRRRAAGASRGRARSPPR